MRKFYVGLIGVFFIFVIMFIIGSSPPCSNIGSCGNCWDKNEIEITSSLCSEGNTCLASSDVQEHNARIDTLICACNTLDLEDSEIQSYIQSETTSVIGYTVDVSTLCQQPGNYLVKTRY